MYIVVPFEGDLVNTLINLINYYKLQATCSLKVLELVLLIYYMYLLF